MQIVVLGSAAGGGFPQWNCHCRMCSSVRNGTSRAEPRTQSSIAVSDDGENWVIINASPDIRQQINASPQLAYANGARGSGVRSVIVTDAQIDHTTGLLILREGLPLDLYCTAEVAEELSTSYPILSMMKHWEGGIAHTLSIQRLTRAGKFHLCQRCAFIPSCWHPMRHRFPRIAINLAPAITSACVLWIHARARPCFTRQG